MVNMDCLRMIFLFLSRLVGERVNEVVGKYLQGERLRKCTNCYCLIIS